MSKNPKRNWKKPELTSLTVQGYGNNTCEKPLARGDVCTRNQVPVSTATCQQNNKNVVFS